MIGPVVGALLGLLRILEVMHRVLGAEFMAFFYEALDKPWLVKRH